MSAPRHPIAIIAGAGVLPLEIAQAARRMGHGVFIVALRGSADSRLFTDFPSVELRIGQLGAMLDTLQTRQITRVAMVGALTRPALSDLRPDAGMLRRLPRIIQAYRGGDDHLLSRVIAIFEDCGLTVMDLREIAPDLVAPQTTLSRTAPRERAIGDARSGFRLLDTIAPFDVGQAVIAINGRIVAIEGAEGTDGLLDRVAAMRSSGRLRDARGKGVLVKAAKPGQDMRIDLPTIGPVTIAGCARAGLAGIAVRAGEVLLTDRQKMIEEADAAGLFLTGMNSGG